MIRVPGMSLLLLLCCQHPKGWSDLGARFEDHARGAEVVESYKDGLLKKGDVVVVFDGKSVKTAEQVMAALYNWPLGKELTLGILRGEDDQRLTVTPLTIEGQAVAGMNNTVHHPSARRAIALEKPEEGDDFRTTYAFDFDVSLAWEASEKELEQIETLVVKAGELFFDMTDGQMRWRTVTVYNNKGHWDSAYYLIQKSGSSGVEHVTPGGQCRLNFGFALDGDSAVIIFAHEAGHMSLGAGDEYAYGRKTREECVCIMSGHCFAGVRDLCVKEKHDYTQPESCWDNLKRFYPNLKAVEKTVAGPKLVHTPKVAFVSDPNAALKREILQSVRRRLREQRRAILDAIEQELDEVLKP